MRENQDNEKPRYSTLHYGVRGKLDINWSEYVVLDMVYHLSAKYGFCTKTVSSIAHDLGLSFNGTKSIIKRMVDRELLTEDPRGLICAPAYIDIAYLDKDVDTSRIAKSAKTINRAKNAKKKIAKSAMGLRKVQPIAKSSDKNNIRTTLESNVAKATLAIESPQTEKEELSILYYQAIKTLGLPTRNHNNVKSTIEKLRKEIPHSEAVEYLNFMIRFYEKTEWDFKPIVTESLEIYSKRVSIKETFKKAQEAQQKQQPMRFGAAR